MKQQYDHGRTLYRVCAILLILLTGALNGCPGWLPTSGPSSWEVRNHDNKRISGIQIVDVNDSIARRLLANQKLTLFSETMGATGDNLNFVVGPGDVIEVSIWETPPAALFGGAAVDVRSGPSTTRVTTFPEQMVSREGFISIPFAGQILAAGNTLQQIEAEVVKRLKGIANQPQVLARLIRNASMNVTIVGEVITSIRMPLTPRGERLLDALAASGGFRHPVDKMTLQITRGSEVHALPLETIIWDPKQNILLHPGDVITAMHQPLSFTVLGATGKNEEINFEAKGISLAQALARVGGLQDYRANNQGVFLFRFEQPEALDWPDKPVITTPDNKVPVVYRVDLNDPATFFVTQSFPVRNKDVIYVANAPAAELQKFLNILFTIASPVISVVPMTK